jgi:D-sedoheptulose 7-phosphate isomerase
MGVSSHYRPLQGFQEEVLMNHDRIALTLRSQTSVLEAVVEQHGASIHLLAQRLVEVFHAGGRLFVLGSGQFGGVADLAASLFNFRLSLDRPPLPVLSLNHDSLLALALCREEQSRQYFSRQLRVLGGSGDLLLVFASQPHDVAVEEALTQARNQGMRIAVFFHGREEDHLGERPEDFFPVQCASQADALQTFLFCGRLICELVEAELFGF